MYYSLQLDRQAKPKLGKYVNHAFVNQVLRDFSQYTAIAGPLERTVEGRHYKHLAALANQAKHYSIIFPSLSEDFTGKRRRQYMLKFPAFKVGKNAYEQIFVEDILPVVHEHLSKCLVEAGHALNDFLSHAGKHIRSNVRLR